jgi:hypothetical protein
VLRTSRLSILRERPPGRAGHGHRCTHRSGLCKRYGEATQHSETSGARTVAVAHQCATVGMADLIVMLDKGRVLEAGHPEALMLRHDLSATRFTRQAYTSR